MKYSHSNLCILTLAAILVMGTPAAGQMAPEEHAQHHPQPGGANPAVGGNPGGTPPGGAMGEMTKELGAGMGNAMGETQLAAGGGPGPGRRGPPPGVGPPGGMGGDQSAAGGGPGPPGRLGPPQPGTANPAAGGNAGEAAQGGGMGPGGGMMGGGKGPGGDMGPGGGMMGGGKGPGGGRGPGGGMMGGSGAGATPIYPSLMTLPALTPEKHAEIEALASRQKNEGRARLAQGSESLDRATQAGDEAAMQESVGLMHEALNELEAGIAAQRVLSEGKAPRNLALDWFKREMRLASPIVRDEPADVLGLSPLHLFTMALLVVFAFAMLTLYYVKMRRAAALFGRVNPDKGPPPPGSAQPLAGGPGPSGGKGPPLGASPPPTAKPGADAAKDDKTPAPAAGEKPAPPASPDKSPEPAEPPAEKTAAPTPPSKAP